MPRQTLDDMQALIDEMPKGFTLERLDPDGFRITNQRKESGCLILCAAFWLFVWTYGAIGIFFGQVSGVGTPPALPYIALFWAVALISWALVLTWFLTRRSVRVTLDSIEATVSCLGWNRTRVFRTSELESFAQRIARVEVMGNSTWNLHVVGATDQKLISCQPHEVSHWLGRLLSGWFDVPYKEA